MKIKLFASGKKYDAQGRYDGTSLTVLKGSRVSDVTKFGSQRDTQIKKNCKKEGDYFVLVKDVVFQTPTAAANFCCGGSVNGWDFWKDFSRMPLKALVEHKITKRPRKKKETSNESQVAGE